MKVNDPNLSSPPSTEVSRTHGAQPDSARRAGTAEAGAASGDDVHLSELVRNLRALSTDSPERQAHIEELARAHASGTYKVDAEATASHIIDDALTGH